MNTRIDKMFQDEFTEIDAPRYSNGNIIKSSWSTPEIAEQVKRITDELFKRGYRVFRNGSHGKISFSKSEFVSTAYLGTFVNPYSFRDPILLWKDHFAECYKSICITEVFRHNGTDANSSLRIDVLYHPGPTNVSYRMEMTKNYQKVNDYGVEIPESYEILTATSGAVKCAFIKKIKIGISDRVMIKMLDKAEEEIAKFEIEDMSKYAKDGDQYPADNSIEFSKRFDQSQRKL